MRLYSADLIALCYTLGCVPLLFITDLPSMDTWLTVSVITAIFTFIGTLVCRRYQLPLTICLCGFLWSTAYAQSYLAKATDYIDKHINVIAIVNSINTYQLTEIGDNSYRYIEFSLLSVDRVPIPPLKINVYWNKAQQPLAGQTWALSLTTRAVHSYLNEGSFDSQRYAIANKKILNAKLHSAEIINSSVSIKQKMVTNLLSYIGEIHYKDIVLALVFGDRTQLTSSNKQIMKNTGTAHLMAISGMHVLLVFIIGMTITKPILFLLPTSYRHYAMPLFVGLLMAFSYAWLSGLNPPSQRAILALSVWVMMRYKQRKISAWQQINQIVAILLIIDPMMVLSDSFWLSVYVVICLIFINEWIPKLHHIRSKVLDYFMRLLCMQLVLSLLIVPMQLFMFNGISSASLIANLLAIPTISFITLPSALFGFLFSHLGISWLTNGCFLITDHSLIWLFFLLSKLSGGWYEIPPHLIGISCIGWIAIIFWRSGYWRHFFFTTIAILFMLFSPLIKKQPYDWRIDMLDVGHGLAIVIHDGRSAILYDTGGRWKDTSSAEREILPFLRNNQLNLEGMIISHDHLDHSGGLEILQQYYPSAWIMSASYKLANTYPCITEHPIRWKQLTIEPIWPPKLVGYVRHKDSCVVRISDGKHSILLTGDLEKSQEYELVMQYGHRIASTFLQIPHHGSKTSSSYPFLKYVSPTLSLGSVARYNPWKLPSEEVLSRYESLNFPYYVTSKSGQISLFLTKEGWYVKTMREKIKPRWYHNWFGDEPRYVKKSFYLRSKIENNESLGE